MTWEIVIGLETHVQLSTNSKLFSRASTSFGAEPNTNVNLVDCGLPGVLPTINKEAFYKAIRFGLAINATINQTSHFDRKNYFYPDLPKGYQITQMDRPIIKGGKIEIEVEGIKKIVNITRAHLEEDAGKSIHDVEPNYTLIDLNRAGTPLLEIVSEPEISSAKEAVAYMKALHQLITFLEVSDGNMSQGSMRCDANVSIRKLGDKKLGTRTEIKNINSFRFIEKAINFEVKRQINTLESGKKIVQETRLYDANKDETRPMRTKEFANDYRYFPEPDLLPVVITDEEISKIKNNFPELPSEKRVRYLSELKLSENDAEILSATKPLSTAFENIIEMGHDPVLAAKWLVGDVSALLNKSQTDLENSNLTIDMIGELLANIEDNTISGKIAKEVLEECYLTGKSPNSIIESKGLKQITDSSELQAILKNIVDSNPEQVTQFRAGKDRIFGYFVGQAMKETKGKGNPELINKILKELLVK
ncbi:MAG: Asp-tRNA(Asn)/Glu-tRNA(Gln) amidotransferase subunit GatB [Gammaproteobacteria bacterium]